MSPGTIKDTNQSTVIYCARTLSIPEGENPLAFGGLSSSTDPIHCTTTPEELRSDPGAYFTNCRSFGAVLDSAQSTPIFEIALGSTNIIILAELAGDKQEGLVCIHISSLETKAPASYSRLDNECFNKERIGILYLSTTCISQKCSDHYFLALSGLCSM